MRSVEAQIQLAIASKEKADEILRGDSSLSGPNHWGGKVATPTAKPINKLLRIVTGSR
jgi:hypothetical protein